MSATGAPALEMVCKLDTHGKEIKWYVHLLLQLQLKWRRLSKPNFSYELSTVIMLPLHTLYNLNYKRFFNREEKSRKNIKYKMHVSTYHDIKSF